MFSLEVENETAPLFDGPFLSANTWKHSMSEKAISPSIQIPIEARRWSLFGIAGVSPHPDEPFGLPRWEGSYAGETRCRGRLSMVSRLEVRGEVGTSARAGNEFRSWEFKLSAMDILWGDSF